MQSYSEDAIARLLEHFSKYPPVQSETVLLVARHWLGIDEQLARQAVCDGRLKTASEIPLKAGG